MTDQPHEQTEDEQARDVTRALFTPEKTDQHDDTQDDPPRKPRGLFNPEGAS